MVKSKKTRAEIQRAYRERLKEKGAEAVEKERRHWHAWRQLNKVKVIADVLLLLMYLRGKKEQFVESGAPLKLNIVEFRKIRRAALRRHLVAPVL